MSLDDIVKDIVKDIVREILDEIKEIPDEPYDQLDAAALGPDELAAALRAGVRGVHDDEAAVELLLDHGYWLGRHDFLGFVEGRVDEDSGELMAWVDFLGVARAQLAASRSDRAVLHVAAQLAGVNHGGPLGVLLGLGGLDESQVPRVLRAIWHASRGPDAPVIEVAPYRDT